MIEVFNREYMALRRKRACEEQAAGHLEHGNGKKEIGMRKLFFLVGIALVGMLSLSGCGKADYDDFVEVNTKFIEAMDEYTSSMDQASSAESVADAIEQFADTMETLAPEMKEIRGKYPEFQDKTQIPEKLRPLNEKAEQVAKRMPQTLMKSMQYMRDPKVIAAMQRLQESMVKMQ